MKPKIGLALGAGGARGFAHIGVLKILEQNGITIDVIAGSSMGALVGALYSLGHSVSSLERMATIFRQRFYLDYTIPKMGLIAGNKIKQLIELLSHGKKIEDLNIPLGVVAVDLLTGKKVVFRSGKVADAVRASISIPGIFVPEKIGNQLLVDGSVIDRVPVSIVSEMGADIVIAVDVSMHKPTPHITSIFDVILQSIDIMQEEMVRHRMIDSTVMIRPQLTNFHLSAFEKAKDMIAIGEREADKKIDEIQQAIADWKE